MPLKLTPTIFLDGTANEAILFYEQVLQAEVLFKATFGEGPGNVPEEARSRIAHSILRIGETELYVDDTFPGQSSSPGDNVQICITAPDVEASGRLFRMLQQGGQVMMPLEAKHFSPAFGIVTDRYGVTFQIFTQRATDTSS